MTKAPTPEAVIFDIGNVLIEWQPERFYDAEIGEDRRRAMFAAIDLHAMNDRVDKGADFRDTIYAEAEANPEWRTEIRMWHDRWLDLARPIIPRSVRLKAALQTKGIPVFALTNFGIGTWEIAMPEYPFLGTFDRAFVSGHMGMTKPDARIYEMVEQTCGIAPDRLLFTDDREENIAAAEARGWQTHLFEGQDGWAEALVARGLLAPDEAA